MPSKGNEQLRTQKLKVKQGGGWAGLKLCMRRWGTKQKKKNMVRRRRKKQKKTKCSSSSSKTNLAHVLAAVSQSAEITVKGAACLNLQKQAVWHECAAGAENPFQGIKEICSCTTSSITSELKCAAARSFKSETSNDKMGGGDNGVSVLKRQSAERCPLTQIALERASSCCRSSPEPRDVVVESGLRRPQQKSRAFLN